MWALLNNDNTINELITRPKGLTIGDTRYPRNIFNMWTASELEALKIYEVVINNTNLKEDSYYRNTEQTFAFADGTVTATYGTATARVLDNVLWTAEDEAAFAWKVEGQVKEAGIRAKYKDNINHEAAGLLASTDWMIIRAAEGGTAVPSATTTWRAAVRTKANSMQAQIDGAANVDALAALYIYNDATPPVRPLGAFPVLGT